jgi:hypothetical protein
VSCLPRDGDLDDREESGRQRLLAVCRVRRGMEHVPARRLAQRRQPVAMSQADLVRELRELIAALDRRLPRVEQAGEASIARDAAALREKAVARLAELEVQETSSK